MDIAVLEGFEGEQAIVEINGKSTTIDRSLLSAEAKEGDILVWNGQHWIKDQKATEERSRQILKLMDDVWGD